jgi:uncharacterized cupin superfamily protein
MPVIERDVKAAEIPGALATDPLDELLGRHDPALRGEQDLEHRELLVRELERAAGAGRGAAGRVEHDVGGLEHGRPRLARPAREGAHARDQLGERHRVWVVHVQRHLRAPALAQLDGRLAGGVHIRFAIDATGRITGIADHLSKRDAAPTVAAETPHGIAQAPLEDGAPAGDGWFAVNLADARWMTGHFGAYTLLEGSTRWPQFGVNVGVLAPGQAACFYHREADQEDFLVLKGEALLLVEGEERPLRAWDFVHCPAWTEHVFVGAGDGPCSILAVGARSDRGVVYPVADVALEHRAGVQRETTLPREAYAAIPPDEPVRFDPGWLPG